MTDLQCSERFAEHDFIDSLSHYLYRICPECKSTLRKIAALIENNARGQQKKTAAGHDVPPRR